MAPPLDHVPCRIARLAGFIFDVNVNRDNKRLYATGADRSPEGLRMSLPILVAMVAVGISLTVLAVHLTGGSRPASIEDAAHARRIFALDHPEARIGAVRLTADGRSAFLGLDDGGTGIVHVFGDCFLTRIVRPADMMFVASGDPAALTLAFRDFTWRGGTFAFADRSVADDVRRMLDPASQTSEAHHASL